MDFKLYIKQASYYKKVLKDWMLYLESFQENLLSDDKSKFKIQELNDRKDLIKCNDLEDLEIFNEIKEIHTLIKKEREVYNNILKLIQEPSQGGLFVSKAKTKKIRNDQFSKYFKKLFSINKEQSNRLNLFITHLELLEAKNEKTTSKIAEESSTAAKKNSNADKSVQKELTAKPTKKNDPSLQAISISNTTSTKAEKNIIKNVKPTTTTPKINVESAVQEVLKKTNKTEIKEVSSENQEDFDYETEMKRILGL